MKCSSKSSDIPSWFLVSFIANWVLIGRIKAQGNSVLCARVLILNVTGCWQNFEDIWSSFVMKLEVNFEDPYACLFSVKCCHAYGEFFLVYIGVMCVLQVMAALCFLVGGQIYSGFSVCCCTVQEPICF